jgi:hypothetical protein
MEKLGGRWSTAAVLVVGLLRDKSTGFFCGSGF